MHQPHVIRLHGPWELALLCGAANTDGPRERIAERVRWPADAGLLPPVAERPAVVRLRRRFARPTGIEPPATIALHIGGAVTGGVAFLNDDRLGDVAMRGVPACFDVTSRLLPRNVLELQCPSPPPGPLSRAGEPLLGEVRLELSPG